MGTWSSVNNTNTTTTTTNNNSNSNNKLNLMLEQTIIRSVQICVHVCTIILYKIINDDDFLLIVY